MKCEPLHSAQYLNKAHIGCVMMALYFALYGYFVWLNLYSLLFFFKFKEEFKIYNLIDYLGSILFIYF